MAGRTLMRSQVSFMLTFLGGNTVLKRNIFKHSFPPDVAGLFLPTRGEVKERGEVEEGVGGWLGQGPVPLGCWERACPLSSAAQGASLAPARPSGVRTGPLSLSAPGPRTAIVLTWWSL